MTFWTHSTFGAHHGTLATLVALGMLALGGCSSAPPPEPEYVSRDPDPAVAELDRLMRRAARGPEDGNVARCLAAIDRDGLCTAERLPPQRIVSIRVALDLRYQQWPDAVDRLADTFTCVNRFYRPTGVQWDVVSVEPWEPGAERHLLYPLLARLHREFPADLQSLRLGITVWEERRIYASGGGEIGLSQGGACVVPSWPRVENDCLILTHELGHLIGAKHVPGKHWVMGWAARPFHLPATDPLARVTSVYRIHPRNVAAIAAFRSARFTAVGLRPTPECRQRIARIDRCYSL